MKRKFDKKIVSGLVISLLSTQMVQALAQGVSTQSSGSTVSSLLLVHQLLPAYLICLC